MRQINLLWIFRSELSHAHSKMWWHTSWVGKAYNGRQISLPQFCMSEPNCGHFPRAWGGWELCHCNVLVLPLKFWTFFSSLNSPEAWNKGSIDSFVRTAEKGWRSKTKSSARNFYTLCSTLQHQGLKSWSNQWCETKCNKINGQEVNQLALYRCGLDFEFGSTGTQEQHFNCSIFLLIPISSKFYK